MPIHVFQHHRDHADGLIADKFGQLLVESSHVFHACGNKGVAGIALGQAVQGVEAGFILGSYLRQETVYFTDMLFFGISLFLWHYCPPVSDSIRGTKVFVRFQV